jgi:hypothetical protein
MVADERFRKDVSGCAFSKEAAPKAHHAMGRKNKKSSVDFFSLLRR